MRVSVFVKPGSKKGPAVEEIADGLVLSIRERAVEGQANAAVIEQIAKHYDVPKSTVKIERGHTSRHKIVSL